MWQEVKRKQEAPKRPDALVQEKRDQLQSYAQARASEGVPRADLGDAMTRRMQQQFLDHQIPSAENEADRLAANAAGAQTMAQVKAQMGQAMGADFSSVRFHTGPDAVSMTEQMGARAYTTGRDVYFGQGGFDPAVAAHELVHTAQQGSVASTMETVSAPAGEVQMWNHGNNIRRKGARFDPEIMSTLLGQEAEKDKKQNSIWGKIKSGFKNLFGKKPVYGPDRPTVEQEKLKNKQTNQYLLQNTSVPSRVGEVGEYEGISDDVRERMKRDYTVVRGNSQKTVAGAVRPVTGPLKAEMSDYISALEQDGFSYEDANQGKKSYSFGARNLSYNSQSIEAAKKIMQMQEKYLDHPEMAALLRDGYNATLSFEGVEETLNDKTPEERHKTLETKFRKDFEVHGVYPNPYGSMGPMSTDLSKAKEKGDFWRTVSGIIAYSDNLIDEREKLGTDFEDEQLNEIVSFMKPYRDKLMAIARGPKKGEHF